MACSLTGLLRGLVLRLRLRLRQHLPPAALLFSPGPAPDPEGAA